MGIMVSEVYEALIEAGASETKAKAATEVIPVIEQMATKQDRRQSGMSEPALPPVPEGRSKKAVQLTCLSRRPSEDFCHCTGSWIIPLSAVGPQSNQIFSKGVFGGMVTLER